MSSNNPNTLAEYILEFFNDGETTASSIFYTIEDDPDFSATSSTGRGIKMGTAENIIAARPQGGFESLDQIDEVEGVGPITMHNILYTFRKLFMAWTVSDDGRQATTMHDVGIGTTEPKAKLHVNDNVRIDGRLELPFYETRLTDVDTDLGAQLQPLIDQHSRVLVTLAANSTFTWNRLVMIPEDHELRICGEGYENFAKNITVQINMTENGTWSYDGKDYRVPTRACALQHSILDIQGIQLNESANDDRPVALHGNFGALFTVSNFGTFRLLQSRGASTDDIVSLGPHSYGWVQFGHTFIDKQPDSVRDILIVKAYRGWGFGGHGGVVSHSHTILGPGVSYENTPRIMYLDGNSLTATADGNVGIGTPSPGAKLDVFGSGAAIRIRNDGTTDRGIDLKADDNVAIINTITWGTISPLTFQINGSEKVRIDGSGKVGIGTPGPSKKLHVESGELRVRAHHNNPTADIGAFYANNLTQGIGIGYNRIEAIGSDPNQDILIMPKGSGKVGIGTPEPGAKLEVTDIRIRNDGTIDRGIDLKADDNVAIINTITWGTISPLTFQINGSEKVRIDGNGNVGIGTPDPQGKLDVRGSSNQNAFHVDDGQEDLRVLSSDNRSYDGGIITLGGSWGPTGYIKTAAINGLAGRLIIGNRRTADATRMEPGLVLDEQGNVGIGTPGPGAKLEVNGSVRGNQSGALRIDTGNGYVDIGPQNTGWSHFQTDRPRYYFDKEIRVDSGLIGSHDENLQLRTSGTTRITIRNDNGNVGIGETSPQAKLHVLGTTIILDSGAENDQDKSLYFRYTRGKTASIDAGGGDLSFIAGVPASERMRIDKVIGFNAREDAAIIAAFRDHEKNPKVRILANGNLELLSGNLMIKDWAISVPDYVFEQDYQLSDLDSLEKYVNENHYLPEIPSAEEIRREGLNLNQMCMLLLKKVEELTLYTIEQNTRIQDLEARLVTS